jgi:hypothetical protein
MLVLSAYYQRIIQVSIPMLESIYAKLRGCVDFVGVRVKRRLISVKSGTFDGDVARMEIALHHVIHKNHQNSPEQLEKELAIILASSES